MIKYDTERQRILGRESLCRTCVHWHCLLGCGAYLDIEIDYDSEFFSPLVYQKGESCGCNGYEPKDEE